MSNSIWRKKPLASYEEDIRNNQLNRVLGKWSLTAMGIGAVIGGGIFVLTGIAAHNHAGPALALSFVIAGVGCIFAALCYSEFASILPVEGSAYAYSYGTIGEFFAWFIGWNLILEYMMGAATVAVSWSGYFEKLLHLFNIHPPLWLMNDPWTLKMKLESLADAGQPVPDVPMMLTSTLPFGLNLAAVLVACLVTYILVKGIRESAKTNNMIVVMKVLAVLFVIVVGMFYIDATNWTPFIPDPVMVMEDVKHFSFRGVETVREEVKHFGFPGVVTAAGIVFFAYIGFDAVSTQAGEAINPRKDIPFAVITSLIICTVLYIAVSLVLTGMVRYDTLDLKAPVAQAFADKGITWAVYIVTIAATVGLISVMLVMMLSQTRIFLGMAKDGLLPRGMFAAIHPKFRTPWKSTILVGTIVALVAAFSPIDSLGQMTSIGTLLAFASICGAVWLLRVREPNLERPYRAPFLPVVATLGMAFNLSLMTSLEGMTWVRLLVWSIIGVSVYFLYSRGHSNLNKK